MSHQMTAKVQRLNLKMEPKSILNVLADQSNEEGENIGCAVDTIALFAGASTRTAQRYIKAFEVDGVLIRTPEVVGRGRCNIWRLNIARAIKLYGLIPYYKERRAIMERGDSLSPFTVPGKGDRESQKGDTETRKGDAVSPIPVKDPVEDPEAADAASADEGACDGIRQDEKPPPLEGYEATGGGHRRDRPSWFQPWLQNQQAIIQAVGLPWWRTWSKIVVPWGRHWLQEGHGIPEDHFILAAPSRYIIEHIVSQVKGDMEQIMGQSITVVRRSVDDRYWQRVQQEAHAELAEQRDGVRHVEAK